MIQGLNSNVTKDGKVYHVQTEDRGAPSHVIESHVYLGGAILATRRTSYEDWIEAGAVHEKKVYALIEER